MGIPENKEQTQTSGIEDFLNGTQTPSRSRRRNTTSERSPFHRSRVATPTNKSRSKSESADETEGRSAGKSYSRTTNENENGNDASSKTPKTRSSSNAKAGGRIVRSPKEIVMSPVKELIHKATNRGSARKQKVTKDASTQTGWEKEVVFKLRLNKDVMRSLQNRAQGDPGRGVLGTGNLMVLKCVGCHVTFHICQFEGDNGTNFQANIPQSSEAHKHMFLNTVPNSIVWEAYDASGEKTRLRRFYFSFDCGEDMFAFLLQFFGGQDVDIVKEFLSGEKGRFKSRAETLPPHSIVKNEDDMDVNSDDEEHRPAPLTEEEEWETYGEVNKETQFF